jgi:hypothetical protein
MDDPFLMGVLDGATALKHQTDFTADIDPLVAALV